MPCLSLVRTVRNHSPLGAYQLTGVEGGYDPKYARHLSERTGARPSILCIEVGTAVANRQRRWAEVLQTGVTRRNYLLRKSAAVHYSSPAASRMLSR